MRSRSRSESWQRARSRSRSSYLDSDSESFDPAMAVQNNFVGEFSGIIAIFKPSEPTLAQLWKITTWNLFGSVLFDQFYCSIVWSDEGNVPSDPGYESNVEPESESIRKPEFGVGVGTAPRRFRTPDSKALLLFLKQSQVFQLCFFINYLHLFPNASSSQNEKFGLEFIHIFVL